MDAPYGWEIMQRAEEPPYRHFKRWRITPSVLTDKKSGKEAEAVRAYGTAKLLANIKPVWQQLAQAIEIIERAPESSGGRELRQAGFELERNECRCDVFLSTTGGSGTGAIVAVLGMLALLIEDSRGQYVVNLHVLLPGFRQSTSAQTLHAQEVKTLATLLDIGRLLEGIELTIPGRGLISHRTSHHPACGQHIHARAG